jgi:hypothetical protein
VTVSILARPISQQNNGTGMAFSLSFIKAAGFYWDASEEMT